MNIKKLDFLEALRKCSPGVDMGKTVFDASDCFVFVGDRVYSYNDKVSVSAKIGLDCKPCAVKGKELVGVLSKLPLDDVEVEFTAKTMDLICGKVRASFNYINYDKNVYSKLGIGDEWVPLGKDWVQKLGLCNIKYSNTMADNRKKISGVYVDKNTMLSSDGKQINVVELEGCEADMFFIHYPFISDLLKFDGICKFQRTKSWLHFSTESGTVVSVRFVPFMTDIMRKITQSVAVTEENEKFSVEVPPELFDAVERASVMSSSVGTDSALRMDIEKGFFEFTGEKTAGVYTEKVPFDINSEIEDVSVFVDIDLFKYMKGRKYTMSVSDVDGMVRLLFKNEGEKHIFSTLNKD